MRYFTIIFSIIFFAACLSGLKKQTHASDEKAARFVLKQQGDVIQVFAKNENAALVTQVVKPDFRPYIHPILAPGSNVALTEYSPGHHKHQTGLYWGFTRVNGSGADKKTLGAWFYKPDKPADIKKQIGRDFFHHPEGSHWKKVGAEIITGAGEKVTWKTVYHMLDESQHPILEETQTWTFSQHADKYLLDLEWQGKAIEDVTVNEFDYGGLFLRMPWKEGVKGEAINAARQRNEKAEGQRAMWVDVGMEIKGLDGWGHIAIFDHPDNIGFPQAWRVDGQLGVGPVRARQGDWHIKKGETETILHQIVAYSGKLDEDEMNKLWGDFIGNHDQYNIASLWQLAQEEGRNAKFLTPEEAVANMTIKEGYQVNVYASEPMITQPMAFCWDDKGRMWIAENRDYESRGHGFSNSGDSRILILEDENKDGVADTRKVFLEKIPFPSAIAVGHGGLWLGAPPNLLFVPDKNNDDKADEGDIKVLLTGWGIRDRHETINSLHWGPDGWLYGLEGFATPSVIRKPKGQGKIYRPHEAFPEDLLDAEGVDINGGVWRYHPLKDKFEAVAHGFSNPWGIDYDSKGQLFISACVIPHLFHIIPGGIYQRQGGSHFNPYVYEDIRTIVDHRHRSAHGGARVYLSDAFPPEEQGRLFMANIHEHAVLSDILKPNGSGFTASHGDDFMMANNAQWIGFSMEVGPEGGLYVLDWHDADICGNEVVNKETGRVFRIMPKQSNAEIWPGRFDDLNQRSDKELVELQRSKSNWHAQRARIILQFRASKSTLEANAIGRLHEMLNNEQSEDIRLRALWTLHMTNHISELGLINLLSDQDQYIRAWAIQLLGENGQPAPSVLTALHHVSKIEKSPVVRLYLAGVLQRINNNDRWEMLAALTQYGEDSDDPNIPFMLWFALEPLVAENPAKALDLAKACALPSIVQKIARRLVNGRLLNPLVAAIGNNPTIQSDLLQGMLAGLESSTDAVEPGNWAAVYKKLQSNSKLSGIADEIAQHFGDTDVAQKMLAVLNNPSADAEQQKKAIVSLAAHQRGELLPLLPVLFEKTDLRLEAIRAMAAYDANEMGYFLTNRYPDLKPLEKQEAILTLSSRPSYGWALVQALKKGTVPRKDIPAYIALQLKRVVGNGFVEVWGPVDEISGDVKAQYSKYQRLLTTEAVAKASPQKGKMIFQRSCGVCHKMHGEGGIIGPDLTGSNRTNTAYLLSNMLEPSADIQDDYKMVVITTQDGRTYSGNIVSENNKELTLRIVGQDAVTINKSKIQSKEISTNSMMPEGLLNTLTDQEVLDLVAFLKKL